MLTEGPMIDAHRVTLCAPDDFDGWREAARDLAEAGVPASAVVWQVAGGEPDLFGTDVNPSPAASFPVPRAFVDLARDVVCHSNPERFAMLYAMLLRLKSDRHAVEDEADPLVRRLQDFAKGVRRDIHKMHAFVRFREFDGRYVAFFEP
jgi:uracil-DNA glycosylase